MDAHDPRPAAIVTLVHGTRSPNARWTLEGSRFREAVQAAVGSRIRFERFVWDAGNSFRSRNKASDQLGRLVERNAARDPGVPQFLIAHSHGGNIAVDQLRRGNATIQGIACMATPFLEVRPRLLDLRPWRALEWLCRITTHLVVFAGGIYVLAPDADIWGLLLLIAAAAASVWLFRALDALVSVFYGRELFVFGVYQRPEDTLRDDAERFLSLLARRPVANEDELLVVRRVGDEASLVLVTAQCVGWALGRVWALFGFSVSILPRLWEWAEERYARLSQSVADRPGLVIRVVAFVVGLWLASVWVAICCVPYHIGVWIGAVPLAIGVAPAAMALVALAASVVAAVAVVPLTAALAVSLLPFGADAALYSCLGEVTVDSTPPGACTVVLLDDYASATDLALRRDRANRLNVLAHQVYDHPRTAEVIGLWIRRVGMIPFGGPLPDGQVDVSRLDEP